MYFSEDKCREIGDVKTGMGGFALLYVVLWDELCEEVTFVQRLREVRNSHEATLGTNIPGGLISKCKGPEAEACWLYSRNSKEVRVAGAE